MGERREREERERAGEIDRESEGEFDKNNFQLTRVLWPIMRCDMICILVSDRHNCLTFRTHFLMNTYFSLNLLLLRLLLKYN